MVKMKKITRIIEIQKMVENEAEEKFVDYLLNDLINTKEDGVDVRRIEINDYRIAELEKAPYENLKRAFIRKATLEDLSVENQRDLVNELCVKIGFHESNVGGLKFNQLLDENEKLKAEISLLKIPKSDERKAADFIGDVCHELKKIHGANVLVEVLNSVADGESDALQLSGDNVVQALRKFVIQTAQMDEIYSQVEVDEENIKIDRQWHDYGYYERLKVMTELAKLPFITCDEDLPNGE